MLVANPIAGEGDVAICIGTVDAMSRSASTFAHAEITESPIQLRHWSIGRFLDGQTLTASRSRLAGKSKAKWFCLHVRVGFSMHIFAFNGYRP